MKECGDLNGRLLSLRDCDELESLRSELHGTVEVPSGQKLMLGVFAHGLSNPLIQRRRSEANDSEVDSALYRSQLKTESPLGMCEKANSSLPAADPNKLHFYTLASEDDTVGLVTGHYEADAANMEDNPKGYVCQHDGKAIGQRARGHQGPKFYQTNHHVPVLLGLFSIFKSYTYY